MNNLEDGKDWGKWLLDVLIFIAEWGFIESLSVVSNES